ncbi:MAG: hypothetical protein PF542_01400 [Nanoarchaeota archaeon]|nr:hypothetical protein [Nanoarchaeota archaeon]
MKNKKGFMDMSFSWIFALIVGAIILFGAVYGVSKFTSIAEKKQSATSAAELGTILDALESGQESAKTVALFFPVGTRISNKCNSFGTFGTQGVSVEEYVNGDWSTSDLTVSWENKYIFSGNIQGKTFYAFTKPFDFPFKVANLMYLTSADDKYCFKDAPRNVRKELKDLGQANLLISDCDEATINVCFTSSSDCDVVVYYNDNYLQKKGVIYPFEGDALMYAAIFSNEDAYECGLLRLTKRTAMLARLYSEKSVFLINTCDSNLIPDLEKFNSELSNYEDSSDLSSLAYTKTTLDSLNKFSRCKQW